MPQALAFYYFNQASFVFLTLAFLVFVVSVYLLPTFVHTRVSRVFITRVLAVI